MTLIIMDGDCLNYDFNLHKQAKTANVTEYNHGPYGEGSVRRRAMYTYPNPLNSRLPFFHLRKIMVVKKHDAEVMHIKGRATEIIRRDDIYENSFHYAIIDYTVPELTTEPPLLTDIFRTCKMRVQRERTPAIPSLRPVTP